MRKKTAFYVASAALATAVFIAQPEANAASLTAETGYSFLPNYTDVQAIDIVEQSETRIVSFSMPVDPQSIIANKNIQLYDVTKKQAVDVQTTVVNDAKNNKFEVHVTLANDATYEEGHEYRLFVGHKDHPIKNVATNVASLKEAVQFNFKATNVPAVETPTEITPPIDEEKPASPAETFLEGTVSAITDKGMTINNTVYTVIPELAAFVAQNKEALQNASIQATVKDGQLVALQEITITKDNATLTGANSPALLADTNIIVAAENVTIAKTQVANIFIAPTVQQAVNIENTTVKGKVDVLADRSPQAAVEEQLATTLTIRFSNSVVVEMLIARVDVKSEISGTSTFDLISVKADTNIWTDENVVLPKVSIEQGVTKIELNASIAQVDIKTTSNLKVTGSGNFDTVNIESEQKIELATTGTIENIAVKNEQATMTIGNDVQIEKVTIPDTLEAKDIITNYDDVKAQLHEKIEKEQVTPYIAAKFVAVGDSQQLSTISVIGAAKDATISYQHYNYNDRVPKVGDKLTDAVKWAKDATVINYFNRTYYVFVTNKDGVITDRFELDDTMYWGGIVDTQTENTLKLSMAAYVNGSTPRAFIRKLSITDGNKHDIIDLTNTTFQYDAHNIPYIEIDISAYDGDVSYFIEELGTNHSYGMLTNIHTNSPHYFKVLHDFANEKTATWKFNYFLERVAYELVDYTDPTGDTYSLWVSKLSDAPSMQTIYQEAFAQKQFTSKQEVNAIIDALNQTNESRIQAYVKLQERINAFYEKDGNGHLVPGTTIAQINELSADIKAEKALPEIDQERLINNHQNLYYAHAQAYYDKIRELRDEKGQLKEHVTNELLTSLADQITKEVDDMHPQKQSLLNNITWLKEELVFQPLHALEAANWSFESERLLPNVTLSQIDAAYTKALDQATSQENKQRVEEYYSQTRYYYALKEIAALTKVRSISTNELFELQPHVTKAQIDAIFTELAIKDNENYRYMMQELQKRALVSLELTSLLAHVNYVDYSVQYRLKENVTMQQFMETYTLLEKEALTKEAKSYMSIIMRALVRQPFDALYDDYKLKQNVTVTQITDAYEQAKLLATDKASKMTVEESYATALYDYANARANVYRVESYSSSYAPVIRLKDGTTKAQIEAIFEQLNMDDLPYEVQRLQNSLLVALQVQDALALLKDDYWYYGTNERLQQDVTAAQYVKVLQALQKTASNDAQYWIEQQLSSVTTQLFTVFLSTENNAYEYDSTRLKEDVTIAQLQETYEQVRTLTNEQTAKNLYNQYAYYYYARQMAALYEGDIKYSSQIQTLKAGTTKAQIEAIFKDVSDEQLQTDIGQLLYTAGVSFELQDVLVLLTSTNKLANDVTITQFANVYNETKKRLQDAQQDLVEYELENIQRSVLSQIFASFNEQQWQHEAMILRKDVTLAQIDALYKETLAAFENTYSVQEQYERYVYYYYAREMFAITNDESFLYNPLTLTEQQVTEAVKLFEGKELPATTTHYGMRLEQLQTRIYAQPVVALLADDYSIYDPATLLKEGGTFAQLQQAIVKTMASITHEPTMEWLSTVYMQVITSQLDALRAENDTYLNENVTLAQLEAIEGTVKLPSDTPLAQEMKNVFAQYYYYYYATEVGKLLVNREDVWQQPLSLKEDVTMADINDLFSTVDEQKLGRYDFEVQALKERLIQSYSMKPFAALLQQDAAYDASPFKASTTPEQVVAAYKEVMALDGSENMQSDMMYSIERFANVALKNVFEYTYFGYNYSNVKVGATAEDVEALIDFLTALTPIDEPRFKEAIAQVKRAVIGMEFNALFVETDGYKTLRTDVTMPMIQDAYAAAKKDVTDEAVLEGLKIQYSDIHKQFYDARVHDLWDDNNINRYGLPTLKDGVTMAQVDDLFTAFTYDDQEADHYYSYLIARLQQQLTALVYLQPLTALIEENLEVNKPFKEGVTLTQINEALQAVDANDNEYASSLANSRVYDFALAIIAEVADPYTYTVSESATVADVNAAIEQLTQLQQQVRSTDRLEAALEHFIAYVNEQEDVQNVAQQDERSSFEALKQTLQQFETFEAIEPFMDETAEGYTFTDDVPTEALQLLIEDISAALEQQIINDEFEEVALMLFVDIATETIHTHNEPVAFTPFAMS